MDLKEIKALRENPLVIILGIATLLIYIISHNTSRESLKLEKFRQTITMCNDFKDWYWMYNYDHRDKHSENLDYLHLWSYPSWDWKVDSLCYKRWVKMNDSVRLNNLINNLELNRLLSYFETAKMMDKAGLLDKKYFYNFFVSTVDRLAKAQTPTFEEYMTLKRGYESNTSIKDCRIYDGFDYCVKNIFIPISKKDKDAKRTYAFKNLWEDLKKYEKCRKGKINIANN